MKKGLLVAIVILMIFSLVGCSANLNEEVSTIAPENKNLAIAGKWKFDTYKILDKNIITDEAINTILNNEFVIYNNSIIVEAKSFSSIEYKLKSVKKDYVISYEANFLIKDLNIKRLNTPVFSVISNKNILGEVIYISKEKSYLYYKGVLFTIHYAGKADENESKKNNNKQKDEKAEVSSEALLLGFRNTNSDNQYRTIWVRIDNGEVKILRSINGIIFPRISGLWKMNVNEVKDDSRNIYYQYLTVDNIEKNNQDNNELKINEKQKQKIMVKYVSSNFIATEVKTIHDDNNSKIDYKVFPIDNIDNNKEIEIGDIYSEITLEVYNKMYQEALKNAIRDSEDNEEYIKDVDYTDFTVFRENGKWNLKGKVPSINAGSGYDFDLDIAPSSKLVNYDTLTVPWKIIKGAIPLINDAFTSPDGKVAVVIANNEMQIYMIDDGKIPESPLRSINLLPGEEVIMSEWCDKENIETWNNVINKET